MINHFIEKIPLFNYVFGAEIFLAISTLLLLLFGIRGGDKLAARTSWIATFILIMILLIISKLSDGSLVNPISSFYKINNFVIIAKVMIVFSAIVSLVLYTGHLNYNIVNSRFEYPVILLLSVLGMSIMVSANDFLTLYMGLELQSLAIYVLVAINKDNIKSSEAGVKYFTLGAFSSGILLYGISLIYGFSGSIFFSDLQNLFSGTSDIKSFGNYIGMLIGMILVITAFCFKISAVPFHMWTPDVYEGAPTPVTLFMSSAPKIAGLLVFLRILTEPLSGFVDDWRQIVVVIAIMSLLVGALGAVLQNNLKRLLAYSSINHVGFMLLGIIVFNESGVQAILIYLILYLVMIFGVFAFLMIVKQSHHSADMADKKILEDITSYAGLSKTMPLVAIGMVVLLLSMAGIPPFSGFFGKFFIFKAVLEEGYYILAVIAAISTVIAIYYYLKIIKIMFFDDVVEVYDKRPSFPSVMVYVMAVLFNLFFFIKPNFLFDISYFSANFIF